MSDEVYGRQNGPKKTGRPAWATPSGLVEGSWYEKGKVADVNGGAVAGMEPEGAKRTGLEIARVTNNVPSRIAGSRACMTILPLTFA